MVKAGGRPFGGWRGHESPARYCGGEWSILPSVVWTEGWGTSVPFSAFSPSVLRVNPQVFMPVERAGGEGTNLLRGNVAGVPNPSVGGLDGSVGQFGPILGALSLRLEGQSASLTDGRTAANSWAPQHHPVPHPSRPEASGPPGRMAALS